MTQPPPPPGAMPPPPTYGMPPAPKRGNGAAIASLILGILGCIPWVTGFLAVVLGVVGLRRARDPQVGGKGVAIAGLILGLLSFVGWSLFGTAIFGLIYGTAPQRALAKQFLVDLSQQDISAAQSMAASSLSQDQIQALADKVKPWGTLQDTTIFSAAVVNNNGREEITVGGIAKFTQGPHAFTIVLVKENGQWKIEKVEFP